MVQGKQRLMFTYMWVLVLLSILGDQMGQNWLKMENSGHCAVLFEDP